VIATRLDSILSNPSINKSLDQVDELTTSVNEMADALASTTKSMGVILKKIEQGQGTFGKMANDTILYHNLNEAMIEMRRLAADIRANPGRYINVKVF
jgi:phospholipid/cholesterol/gamma-HCH transport system substrate-binding protein